MAGRDGGRCSPAWWEARIARQKRDRRLHRRQGRVEYLYDKPYADPARVRVAGPFTVESVSPHRTLAVDWNDELVDERGRLRRDGPAPHEEAGPERDFAADDPREPEGRRRAAGREGGPDRLHRAHRLARAPSSAPRARYMEGDVQRRAGIFLGPEFGTVSRPDLVAAAREAARRRLRRADRLRLHLRRPCLRVRAPRPRRRSSRPA